MDKKYLNASYTPKRRSSWLFIEFGKISYCTFKAYFIEFFCSLDVEQKVFGAGNQHYCNIVFHSTDAIL